MIEIEWDISLTIGNAEIDAQHKSWLALINRLHSDIVSRPQTDSLMQTGQNAIAEIKAYCHMHFECEERLMADVGYQDIDRHRRIHENFLKNLEKAEQGLINDTHGTVTELFKTMGEWLVNHIMNEDMKIGFTQIADDTFESEQHPSHAPARDSLIPQN